MNEESNFRDNNDTSPAKSGQLKMPITCVICSKKRGEITLEYLSDKDIGLFRAVCVCQYCKDTPAGQKIISDNKDKPLGHLE